MANTTLHPGRACLACRRRKTKCDGVKPVCQRCARLGGECLYDPPERTPQTVRLQTRLRKLENELRTLSQRPSRISQRLQDHVSGEAQPQSRQRAVPPFIPLFPDVSSSQTASSRSCGSVVAIDLLEGYGTSVPRDELESALRNWNMQGPLPSGLTDYLIRVFLAFRRQFHFYTHIPTFLSRSRLRSSDPNSIHPALLNAILLAACACAGGVFWELESLFLERTRRQLEEALAYADRLTHFLWGNIILTSYYLRYGRAMEAQVAVSSTVRFAVAAGLHLEDPSSFRTSMQLPPADQFEMYERRKLWHSIHMLDLTVASVCGSAFQAPATNMASFENVVRIVTSPGAMPTSAVFIRSMANCAFHTARTFTGQFRSTPPHLLSQGFYTQHSTLTNIILNLLHLLPKVNDPRGTEPLETMGRTNPDFVQAAIELRAAMILMWNVVGEGDVIYGMNMNGMVRAGEENGAVASACLISDLMREVSGEGGVLSAIQAPVALLPCIFIACEALVREIGRNSANNSPGSSQQSYSEETYRQAATEQHLETLVDALVDITIFYPAWIGWAQKLRDLVQSVESFNI